MQYTEFSSGVLFLVIILPVLLTGIAHLCIIRFDLFSIVKIPLDAGAHFNDKRIFGDNKTWRGLFVMTILTSLFYALFQYWLFERFELTALVEGALLGLGYSIGELPNSLIKRQKRIEEGKTYRGVGGLYQYFFDQIDSVIGVTIIATFLFDLRLSSIAFLVLTGTLIHIIVDFIAHTIGLRSRKAPMKRYIVSQILVFLFCKFLFRVLNSIETHGTHNLDSIPKDIPLIIAANHRNRFDSYLLAGAMSWKHFKRLLPKRYMTASRYMDIPWLGTFLRFCGAYTTAVENGEKTHYRSKDMLHRGETIMIYPEGHMTEALTGSKRAKVGAFWIMRGVENTQIIPIRIESTLRTPVAALFRGGQKFKVTFGPVFRPDVFAEDLQPQINTLMDTIYSL